MKKSIILSIAAAAAFATAAFTANTVSAADETPATGTTTKAPGDKTATVNLKAGENSNNNSAIELTSAPNYTFDATFGKDGTATDSKPGDAAVTVENPGIAATWTVTTSLATFKGTGATTGSLKGATLILPATSATGTDGATIDGAALKLTESNGVFASSKQDPTTHNFTGIGTLSFGTNTENATLNVPAGNVAGSYQANLTWTLAQTPAAEPQA